jgi:hypothetical protein
MERIRRLLTNGGKRSPWLWAAPAAGAIGTLVAAFLIMPDVPLAAKLPIALVMAGYMVIQAALYMGRDEPGPDEGHGGSRPSPPEPQPPLLRIPIEAWDRQEPAPQKKKELEKAGRP